MLYEGVVSVYYSSGQNIRTKGEIKREREREREKEWREK